MRINRQIIQKKLMKELKMLNLFRLPEFGRLNFYSNAVTIMFYVFIWTCAAEPVAHRFDYSRSPNMTGYNIAEPWKSKALSPVQIAFLPNIEPLSILKDGQPNVDIIVPATGEFAGYYKEIAETLRDFLNAACGVKFSILTEAKTRKGIYVGPCDNPIVQNYCKEIVPKLPDEGFTVISFSKGILLVGKDALCPVVDAGAMTVNSDFHSKGTFFAACDFLERLLGFRFYFPGELGMHIPFYQGRSLNIPALKYTDQPVFALRRSSYANYDTLDKDILKADRKDRTLWLRMQRTGDIQMEKFDHTDCFWHEFYAKSNPEFFAVDKDGRRMIGKKNFYDSQRCYTNAAGFQEHLKLIERAYKGENVARLFGDKTLLPNKKYIYWFLNDGFRGCWCSDCLKLTDPGAANYAIHSRLIWDYINRLSEAVRQKWPDKIIKTPLYATYGTIPENVTVPDNVSLNVVRFGSGRYPAAYFKEPAYWQDALREVDYLNKKSKQKMWVWVHYPHSPRFSDSLNIPYPVPNYMQKYLSLNREKLSGLYLNGHQTNSFALDGLIMYLWLKLLWNPEIDINAFVDEYCHVLWGPVAPEIKEYYSLLIDRWENTKWSNMPPPDKFEMGLYREAVWTQTYPKNIRQKLKDALSHAVTKTATGTLYRERAKYLLSGNKIFFEQGEFFDKTTLTCGECASLIPVIDGNLQEWSAALPFELLDNETRKPTDIKTSIYAAYDNDSFYVAGKVFCPDGGLPKETGNERDLPVWRNNSIEIFLCTERVGFKEAGINLKVQYHQIVIDSDGRIFDAYKAGLGQSPDKAINLDILLKTKKTSTGFDFEMKISQPSLGCVKPQPGTRWLCNFFQNLYIDGKHRSFSWSPTPGGYNAPDYFGELVFPSVPLYLKKFNSNADKFSINPKNIGAGITVSQEIKDGQCLINVKSRNDLKSGKPGENEFKLNLSGLKMPEANTHCILKLRYKFIGRGLVSIRSYGADGPINILDNRIITPGKDFSGESPWYQIEQEFTKDKKILKNLTYIGIGLIPAPGADFTFILDRISVENK